MGPVIPVRPQTANTVTFWDGSAFASAVGIAYSASGNGTLIARQIGGTAGTDEIQISHNGSRGLIESKDGYLELHSADQIAGRSVRITQRSGGAPAIDAVGVNRLSVDGVLCAPGTSLGWAVDSVGRLASTGANGFAITFGQRTMAQIVADTHDYSISHAGFVRLSSDGAYNLTGVVAGVNGQFFIAANVGANTLTLKHQDSGSFESQRFASVTGADLAIAANEMFAAIYDGTTTRWRVWKL